jgi:hypothetical protein
MLEITYLEFSDCSNAGEDEEHIGMLAITNWWVWRIRSWLGKKDS